MPTCSSHIKLFVIPWTLDGYSPLSMKFSRQEYWNGFPFPTPLEGIHLNTIKDMYGKLRASIKFYSQKLKAFPLRPGTR